MDNVNMTPTPEPKKNKSTVLIPIIAGVVALVLVAIIVIVAISLNNKQDSSKKNTAKNGQVPETIEIVKKTGDEGKAKKIDISVRDVKFGDKIKSVKSFEKKQEDTLDSPSQASTKDGYTYLTYNFSPSAKFYGVKPAHANRGGLLQYVFKNKKLFDIRIQLGDIKKDDIKKISKALNNKYGKPTFTIKYSNDSWLDSWRTYAKKAKKQTILRLNYSPQGGTVVSYESVGR